MSRLWSDIRADVTRGRSMLPIEKRDHDQVVPLTFSQQRIWFVEQLKPGRPQHHLNQNLDIVGPLDVDRFRSALQLVIDQHEALRTSIRGTGGMPHQHIEPSVALDLELVDLSNDVGAEIDSTIRSHMDHEIDTSSAPLWRFKLFRLSSSRCLLIGRIHHIIFDRWSRDILTRALFDCYNATARRASTHADPGTTSDMKPGTDLRLDYGDFAVWQRANYTRGWLDEQLARWRAHFGGPPQPTSIPADRIPSAEDPSVVGRVTSAIPDAIVQRATMECGRIGVSWFTLLLTVYFVLLHKYTAQSDLMLCSPVAGRNPRQTRSMIGFFSNILVYRVMLEPNSSITDSIRHVADRVRGFNEFSELPFDVISTTPELRSVPIDNLMFAFHNTPPRAFDGGDLSVRTYRTERTLADQRLALSVFRRRRQYFVHATFRAQVYSTELVQRLVDHYIELLDALPELPSNARLANLASRVDTKPQTLDP